MPMQPASAWAASHRIAWFSRGGPHGLCFPTGPARPRLDSAAGPSDVPRGTTAGRPSLSSGTSAGMQGGWCVVGPGRLAEIVARMAAERRPERLGPAVLDAALAVTGARGGRVAAAGRTVAVEGDA